MYLYVEIDILPTIKDRAEFTKFNEDSNRRLVIYLEC